MLSCAPQSERKLELKYCERCGGLWIRPQGSGHPYCAPCTVQIKNMLQPQARLRRRYRRRQEAPNARPIRPAEPLPQQDAVPAGLLAQVPVDYAGGVRCL